MSTLGNRLGAAESAADAVHEQRQAVFADVVVRVIRGILDDLELTAEQRARVPEIVPRHLRAVSRRGAVL